VAKSDSSENKQKTQAPIKEELRAELEGADTDLFDRYMKWRSNVPKDAIEQKAKKTASK
jgi:hypothetical protein